MSYVASLCGAGSVIRGGAPPFPHAIAVLPPLPANQNHNHNHHHHHHHHHQQQHYHDHHHHHQPPIPQGEFASVCLFRLYGLHCVNLAVSLSETEYIKVERNKCGSMHAKQCTEILRVVDVTTTLPISSIFTLEAWALSDSWWKLPFTRVYLVFSVRDVLARSDH